MVTFVFLQMSEPEYCNFNDLHTAGESCPMLPGSTVLAVKDNHTPASHIHRKFVRFAYSCMLEQSVGHCMRLSSMLPSNMSPVGPTRSLGNI